jgi:hypothetical protein
LGVYELEIPTTTVAGANVANGQKWQREGKRWRKIVRMGLVGSAAIRDTTVSIFYGSEQVAKLYNVVTAAGFTKLKLFWHTSALKCPPGTDINVIVDDPPNTSSAWLYLDLR